MSFASLSNVFDTVYTQVYKTYPDDISFRLLEYRTMRFLDALGHCDYDFVTRHIYACPPSLVLLPSFGLSKILLIGARNQDLLTRIKKYSSENRNIVEYYAIPQKVRRLLLPKSICLETASRDLLLRLSSSLGIRAFIDQPASWQLINFCSDISQIIDKLSFEARKEPGWPKRTFSTTDLSLDRYHSGNKDVRLVEYTNPVNQQRIHWLWLNESASEVDREWGRFIVLKKLGVNILLYDSKKFLLAIPVSVPVPRIMSRALALCTGLAPAEKDLPISTHQKGYRFNIYEAVVPSIAEAVSRKLGQTLIMSELSLSEDR